MENNAADKQKQLDIRYLRMARIWAENVLHAEANAITKVARSNNASEGSTLYVTTSPCMECSKLIIQAGIKRVVFSELYRISDGMSLLKEAGVEVIHLPLSEIEES